jgi:hypothetical protein
MVFYNHPTLLPPPPPPSPLLLLLLPLDAAPNINFVTVRCFSDTEWVKMGDLSFPLQLSQIRPSVLFQFSSKI